LSRDFLHDGVQDRQRLGDRRVVEPVAEFGEAFLQLLQARMTSWHRTS
jgi:hypothetical protein